VPDWYVNAELTEVCLHLQVLSSPTDNLSSLIFFNLTKLRGPSYNLPFFIILYNDNLSTEKFTGQREYYVYDKLWAWERNSVRRAELRAGYRSRMEMKVKLSYCTL